MKRIFQFLMLTLALGTAFTALLRPATTSAQVRSDSIIDISDPRFGCVGDGKTVNTTCFTTAAAAACQAGGKAIFIPAGRFLFAGIQPELIKIPCALTISGSGWSSVIEARSSVDKAVDVMHLTASSPITGCVMRDFQIISESGTPARYGINFDAMGKNAISYCKIDHIRVGRFGSYAIASTNADIQTGSPFTTTITDSYIDGGISLKNAGDSIRITQNTITGPRSILLDQVGCGTNDNGAHLMYLADNNITADGGIQVINGTTLRIVRNNIEQPRPSTEPNGALIDLDGNAACPIINALIEENYLGATTKNVPTATIRVSYAEGTIISRNYSIRSGGASKTYLITAHARNTIISQERPVPNGELPATFLSDSGTNSFVEYYNGSGLHHLGKEPSTETQH